MKTYIELHDEESIIESKIIDGQIAHEEEIRNSTEESPF